MMISKSQWYVLGLVVATILSANIQSVNALTTQPVGSLESRAARQSNDQIVIPAAQGATLISLATPDKRIDNHTNIAEISTDAQASMMLANGYNQNNKGENTKNTVTKPASNSSNKKPSGSLVSTSYNTVSMLRTMDDLQSIGYLGMKDVKEPISDALNRELKVTTNVAYIPDDSCLNSGEIKLPSTCQNKKAEKTATMLMIPARAWSAQMDQDFSFWQINENTAAKKSSK